MDVFTDPRKETYITGWKTFTYPDDTGGKTAIAVTSTDAGLITALYTILIMGIFMMGWTFLLSLLILFVMPEKMTRTRYIAIIAVWNANDPLHATLVISRHTLHIIGNMIRKKSQKEFTRGTLLFDLAILFIAAGCFAGSMTMSLIFPELLVIGSAASVNPNMVFYPRYQAPTSADIIPEFGDYKPSLEKLQYSRMGALRSFGAIEGSEVTISDEIHFEWPDANPVGGKPRYRIDYGYSVTGADMGLQHFGKLRVTINGSCNFQDQWFNRTIKDTNIDEYHLWPDLSPDSPILQGSYRELVVNSVVGYPTANFRTVQYKPGQKNAHTGTTYYTITPVIAGKRSFSTSSDPWYETEKPPGVELDTSGSSTFQIKSARPPLECEQTDIWSYGNWKGTLADMFGGPNRAPFTLPEAIEQILLPEFTVPMIVNVGRAFTAGALKSATSMLPDYSVIDAHSAKAHQDMKRIVLAAYLATRHIFRDAAMAGLALGTNTEIINILRRGNSMEMVPGTGDFVIVSSVVTTLRFGYVVAIPSILGALILAHYLFSLGRRLGTIPEGDVNPSRWSRFLMFAMGLHATQLYRMVDQILNKVEVEGDSTLPDSNPWCWTNQADTFPQVSNVNPKDDSSVPQLMIINTKGSSTDPDKYTLILQRSGTEKKNNKSKSKAVEGGNCDVNKLNQVDLEVGGASGSYKKKETSSGDSGGSNMGDKCGGILVLEGSQSANSPLIPHP